MADKSKTIKGATDKELDELLDRIRKERELQYLVADLKRAGGKDAIPYDAPNISTEAPIDSLYHWGILGMQWGQRKGKSSSKSKAKRKTTKKEVADDGEDDHSRSNLQKKNLHTLSDAQLKDVTTRLQLEKQYKDLTKKEMSIGKKFVLDQLNKGGEYLVKKGLDELSKKLTPK